jgi:microcystin degradation protein MlrC
MVRYAEIFSALRTAPHRDGVETLLRTARLLLRCIKEGLRPRSYWVKVPLLLPGECVITEIEPGRSLYNLLDDADKTPGVLCSSIMVGFAWADTPWTTSGIIVSGTDRDACHSTAIRLAKSFWDMRHQFQVEGESCSISEALERASVSATRPVFISDSGDNITAGAPGETINFLADVRRIKAGRILYAQIYSPKGVITCQEHAIGEKLTIRFGDAVLEGVIKSVTNGSIDIVSRTEAFTVVLFQTPYMDLLITDKRFPIVDPARFIQYGAPLLNYDIVIFKLGYLMPELRDIATRHIMAISEGCTTLDLKSLSYKRLAEPLFPRRDNFEPDFKVNPD